MVLLVKSHREYYTEFPLISWMHGSEACEHVFGIARQIRADFDFAEILQMVPKISQYMKSLNNNLSFEKEKSVREGYICDYNKGNLTKDILSNLTRWPSDTEIIRIFRQSRQLACELAEYLGMLMPDSLPIENLQPIVLIEETTTEPEVSFLSNIDADDGDDDNDIDLSHAIGQASEQIANMDSVCDLNGENNEYINKDITEFQAQKLIRSDHEFY
ncbi:hypothetical protein Glove_153g32 [Diversispora epigaea]|uniref:Uncharacterized protein n=1 Tax=Diversispora epigaea TaxID=1348612 RepID=A0A397IV85_9GLOM|nr:hypothetical protein Glove_153g32 [Diversispora epigaea]